MLNIIIFIFKVSLIVINFKNYSESCRNFIKKLL